MKATKNGDAEEKRTWMKVNYLLSTVIYEPRGRLNSKKKLTVGMTLPFSRLRTGLVTAKSSVVCSYGNFSPVDRDEVKEHNQNGGTSTCIVRDCHSFVDSCKARFKRRILHAPNRIAELSACKMRRLNQLNATYFNLMR